MYPINCSNVTVTTIRVVLKNVLCKLGFLKIDDCYIGLSNRKLHLVRKLPFMYNYRLLFSALISPKNLIK
jgi:hypothetical protein